MLFACLLAYIAYVSQIIPIPICLSSSARFQFKCWDKKREKKIKKKITKTIKNNKMLMSFVSFVKSAYPMAETSLVYQNKKKWVLRVSKNLYKNNSILLTFK